MENTTEEQINKPVDEPIDQTARRLGIAMRNARTNCQLSIDAAAVLLRILPMELAKYERGIIPIPTDIMQRLTIMGYKMIEARRFDNKYVKMRRMMRILKGKIAVLKDNANQAE